MQKIVASISRGDLTPVLSWTQSHRMRLVAMGSSLEFKIHKHLFISLVLQKKSTEAIEYARKNFFPFGFSHKNGF